MDSFKFNSLNYQDTSSLVESQNKIIDDLMKDNKVLSQDRANYATFRAKESQRQLQQLGNIIAGVPKLKKEIEAAKERKEASNRVEDVRKGAEAAEETARVNRTGVYSTGMEGRSYDNPGYIPLTKDEIKKRKLDQEITGAIQDPKIDSASKTGLQKGAVAFSEANTVRNNTSKFVKDQSSYHVNKWAGEGEGYRTIAEQGQFKAFDQSSENYLIEIARQPWFKELDKKKQLLFVNQYDSQISNYRNQAARAWVAKSNTIYTDTRRNGLLEDIAIDPGKAIEDYIFKHEYFGSEKNTGAAISQLMDDLEALENDGLINSKLYGQILSGKLTDRSSNKSKEVRELNNRLSTWIEGRRATLISQENRQELAKDTQALKDDLEETEVRFEEWNRENPNATVEEEHEWRVQELKGVYKRNPKFAAGHQLYQPYLTGMTRLDGPDHSITLTKLIEDHGKGAPLDDTMFQNLPRYWKNQFQKAIGGNDGQEGSSATGTSGSLTFKSMFNPIAEKGPWESFVSDKLGETDVRKSKTLDWYWIRDQGKKDWIAKFKELKTKGSVEDAQQGAFNYIIDNYDRYAKTPRPKGFDPTFTEAVTEGRADLKPRLEGKSQEAILAVLNQDSFWGGEEVPYRELVQWSQGYGRFPEYYRQVDFFKDMTPREIALHRMKIHQAREEKSEAVDNAVKAIYKGVELDNKLYNSLPLDTSRLLTNHNTASRTYRAEVQEKENTDLYEHVKVNDDANAYKPANPYSDHVPSGNLSEMPLIEVLTESGQKRLKALGLYGLNPRDIMNVISEEEKTNGFLDTTFDEKLQTELKRRLARLSANRANQYSALTESPNPLPNIIEEDANTLTELFGPQDWYSIPPNILQEYLKELQKQN